MVLQQDFVHTVMNLLTRQIIINFSRKTVHHIGRSVGWVDGWVGWSVSQSVIHHLNHWYMLTNANLGQGLDIFHAEENI
jgi:hypothetical protein